MTIHLVNSDYIYGTIEFTGYFPTMPPTQQFSIYTPTWDVDGSASGFLIPANLGIGQTIPGMYPTTTVQGIVSWQGRRAVKATTFSGEYQTEGFWDQATGVLLEARSTMMGQTFSIKAVETNMFSLGFDWLLIIIIVVVVVVAVLAIVLVLRLRKRPAAPTPPTQVQPPPPPPPPPPPSP